MGKSLENLPLQTTTNKHSLKQTLVQKQERNYNYKLAFYPQ